MKKIIVIAAFTLFILLGIFTNKNSVYAYSDEDVSKPLVCVVGYDYSNLLDYVGYKVISKAVDFENAGTYYVTYLNETTKKTITKRVDVINESNLEESIYYRANINNIILEKNKIIDTVFYNEYIYILEQVDLGNYHSNFILTKLKNETVIYSREIKSNLEATINKLLLDDDCLYLCGTIYKEGYSTDLYFLKIDLGGQIISENTLGGNSVDSLHDAFLYGDYIYLCGNTLSSGGVFEGVRKQEDGYVMKVNKDLLSIENIYVSILPNINEINNIIVYNDLVYVIEKYTNLEKVMYKTNIYTLDLDINATSEFVNSYALTPLKIINTDGSIYLIAFQYNYMIEKYASRVYEILDNAKTKLVYEYTNYDKENLRIIDMEVINDQMLFLCFDKTSKVTKILIKNNDQNNTLTININCNEPLSLLSKNKFVTNNYEIVEFVYISKEEDVYINNQKINLSEKSIINTDFNVFGLYKNIYVYESEDIIFSYQEDIFIEPNVSVIDHETFDNNLKLTFNGKGYLNGNIVQNGYIISEPGEYILEVIGKNDERRFYEFNIANISHKNENNSISSNLIGSSQNVEGNISQENLISFEKHINNNDKKTYLLWVILIPISLLVVSLILIFRRKHEK